MIELNSVELEVLDANMLTFCCLMEVKHRVRCVSTSTCCGRISETGGRVLNTRWSSVRVRADGKEKWEFLFSTFLRQDTEQLTKATVLSVSAVCLHIHNNSGVCFYISIFFSSSCI